MTWQEDYRLYAINFHPDGGSSLVVGGTTNANVAGNPEVLAEISAGQIYPGVASLQTLRPVLSFSSFDLIGLLDANGPGLNGGTGSCVHAGDTEPGLELFYSLYECAGPSASTSTVHRKYTIADGIIVPTSLTVDHRGNAQLNYDVYMVDDTGAGSPIVKASVNTAALPTITNNDYRWTMNAMTVTASGGGSTTVEGKRNINIAFNPSVTQEGADSTTFDSVVTLNSFRPRVTVTGVDIDWLGTVADLSGHTAARATTIIYFKERNGAANDISIAFDGLINWDTIVSGGPEASAQSAFAIDVTLPSGQTSAFVVNTNATLP